MNESTSFRDWAIRAVSVLGLLAILLLGIWGIIQIALATPDFFAHLGSKDSTATTTPNTLTSGTLAPEQLAVSAPSLITSGQPFTLSWNHQHDAGNYGYTIAYSCVDGLSMYAPTPSGNSAKVPCDTQFNFTNASANVALTPTLAGKSQTGVTFTVAANKLQDGTVTTSGTTTSAVLPAASAAAPTAPTPVAASKPKTAAAPSGSTYVAAKRANTLWGVANLSVQIQSVAPSGGRWNVQFVIANTGTNVAPYGWIFSTLLPLNPIYTYTSEPQQALYPGDKIVYTLGFVMPAFSPAAGVGNNCGYTTSYTYDGMYNISNIPSYACANNSTNYYTNTYNYYANQAPYNGYQKGTVSIIVDSKNMIQEATEVDNTASASL